MRMLTNVDSDGELRDIIEIRDIEILRDHKFTDLKKQILHVSL